MCSKACVHEVTASAYGLCRVRFLSVAGCLAGCFLGVAACLEGSCAFTSHQLHSRLMPWMDSTMHVLYRRSISASPSSNSAITTKQACRQAMLQKRVHTKLGARWHLQRGIVSTPIFVYCIASSHRHEPDTHKALGHQRIALHAGHGLRT